MEKLSNLKPRPATQIMKLKYLGARYPSRLSFTRSLVNTMRDENWKIKRKYFRKGIAKAYKMISFFAKETEKKPRKKWEVYHVEGHFELSVTGGLGLASLSGIAAARVNFYKK